MNAMERIQKMLADHHDMTMSPFMQTDEADALATLLALADAAVATLRAREAYYAPASSDERASENYRALTEARRALDAAVAAFTEATP